jgi:LDH2 family malate/lactate/ureidoglycolate dehydrogenase
MLTFTHKQLEEVGCAVLERAGTPADLAQLVVHSLVESNLLGHDSHGVLRLMSYVDLVRTGRVKPAARAVIAQQTGATAIVDGLYGWGQPAAQLAARTAVSLAEQYGVGAVTIAHGNHLGRLGEYADMITRTGCIGIAMANVGPGVAPFGGRTRMLGTNPMAYAVPRGPGQNPILVDFATSGVAEGKLMVARDKGAAVAPGLIIDKEGLPATDPNDYFDGGALLTFGLHKGYGLSLMCELLGGALSGTGPSSLPDFSGGNGTLIMALKIQAFVPTGQFADHTERLYDAIKAAPPAPGVEAVLMPGDPEWRTRQYRLEHGIQLPERTWNDIQQLARELGALQ